MSFRKPPKLIAGRAPTAADLLRDAQDGNETIAIFDTLEEAEAAVELLSLEINKPVTPGTP